MARKDGEQKLGEALKGFISAHGLQKGLDQVDIVAAWEAVMGPGVAGYTRQVRLRGTTLRVELTSSVLREELSLGNRKIVEMLNAHMGREVVEQLFLQ
ncbi:DUF721 domain-containing protein [Robiginitalea sp. M366]|uniref:DUF721 domain-containing protein n=1 Tax=Robiginitalea aestuariiviva TaxID=3036903 RepID=UPI00240E8821|nr:DUF721 domain-containing protein [Robiginitalea aestuariiviva]MDG1573241.1 DUF721 domain-containing protein [Robiginitalea aestuariiviva]